MISGANVLKLSELEQKLLIKEHCYAIIEWFNVWTNEISRFVSYTIAYQQTRPAKPTYKVFKGILCSPHHAFELNLSLNQYVPIGSWTSHARLELLLSSHHDAEIGYTRKTIKLLTEEEYASYLDKNNFLLLVL